MERHPDQIEDLESDPLPEWRGFYNDHADNPRPRDVFAMWAWLRWGALEEPDTENYQERAVTRDAKKWAGRFEQGVYTALQFADRENTRLILLAMTNPAPMTAGAIPREALDDDYLAGGQA